MIGQLALPETEDGIVNAMLKQHLPILEAIILDAGRPGFVQARMQDDASIAMWLLLYLLHWVFTFEDRAGRRCVAIVHRALQLLKTQWRLCVSELAIGSPHVEIRVVAKLKD